MSKSSKSRPLGIVSMEHVKEYERQKAIQHKQDLKDSDETDSNQLKKIKIQMEQDKINRKESDKRIEYMDKIRPFVKSGKVSKEEYKIASSAMKDGDFSIIEKLIKHHSGSHHKEPEAEIDKAINHSKPAKKSKPALLAALMEAHKDNFISKSMVEKYKKDIDEGNTKALKSRLKHLEYEHESDDDKEPVEKYVPDEEQYKPKPLPKKERAKQIPVRDIGSELHKRTRKAKISPETKKQIMDYVKLF